jgi:hypothetical protein
VILLKTSFYLSCLFFFVSVSAAEKIGFDIDGLKIGDVFTEAFFENYCPKNAKDKKEIQCKRELTVGGVPVVALYLFYDSELISVSLSYETEQYPALVKAYSNKFAHPPHKKVEESIILTTGEKHSNEKVIWTTVNGDFTVEKYGNNFTRGYAHLNTHEYKKYVDDKKAEARGEDGFMKKIFGDIFD